MLGGLAEKTAYCILQRVGPIPFDDEHIQTHWLDAQLLFLQEVQHFAESVIFRVGRRVKSVVVFYLYTFLVQRAALLSCIFYTKREPVWGSRVR